MCVCVWLVPPFFKAPLSYTPKVLDTYDSVCFLKPRLFLCTTVCIAIWRSSHAVGLFHIGKNAFVLYAYTHIREPITDDEYRHEQRGRFRLVAGLRSECKVKEE